MADRDDRDIDRQREYYARRRAPRAEAMSAMRSVINRLRLLRSKHAEEIQHRLTLAGWRSKDALVVYLFFKIFLPFVFGAVGLVVLYIVELYDVKPMMRLTIPALPLRFC